MIDKNFFREYNLYTKEFIAYVQYIPMKGEMFYDSLCKGDCCLKLNIGENVISGVLMPFICVMFPQLQVTFHNILTIKDT